MSMPFNEYFARVLRTHDVEVMFGVMGDANMYIADSFHRLEGGTFIAAANEGGAVQMAAGYAAVSGTIGVATVTHGAIANCVSALFDAVRGHYPVVIIAGDTADADAFHLQNIPQREVVVPTGAAYHQVQSVESAHADLAAAIREASSSRVPVVLGVPADLQQAACLAEVPVPSHEVAEPTRARREQLEDAAGAIFGSNRPLVLAGRGASGTGAVTAVRRFAERIGAPLTTTLRGKNLFAGDEFDLGIFGTLANPVASETIGRSDCIIAFGASLSALTTLRGHLLDGKRVIQIDSDPAAFGLNFPVDVAVLGDVEGAAKDLVALLDEAEAPATGFRSADLARQIGHWHDEDRASAHADDGPLTLSGVLNRIDGLIPRARTLTIDGGRFSHEALRILTVEGPRDYAHCLNVGHIGMSVGYGVGAAVGRPDRPCLVIAGDGGFMLGGIAEFNTAVRYGLDLVVVILNDSAYGAEYYRFVGQSFDPALTTFAWPSFAQLAEALGGHGVVVREWADFEAAARIAGHVEGPVLIEVVLDRDAIPDPGEH